MCARSYKAPAAPPPINLPPPPQIQDIVAPTLTQGAPQPSDALQQQRLRGRQSLLITRNPMGG
jgi:hypothetical protein